MGNQNAEGATAPGLCTSVPGEYDITPERQNLRAAIAAMKESLATLLHERRYQEWQRSLDHLCAHGPDSGPDVTPSQEPNPYGTSSERSDG